MNFNTWPYYGSDEINAAVRVLESGKVNYWTGDEGRKFEQEFAAYHGAKYGVAVANGTVALDLALWALGIGPGDEVVVTPRTFVASAFSIALRGAVPVFADVDLDSGNISPASVLAALTPRTKALMMVHLAGWPCDMHGLTQLAEKEGLYLIEDCAQAHGASWQGRLVGSFGQVGAFSFCTDKIMSTGGEGGMLITSDYDLWRRMWSYKDHGKDWGAVYSREHGPGYRWVHESLGTNWRLTEMQSAMGRVQLGKLQGWIQKRRENAWRLIEGLSNLPGLRVPVPGQHAGHVWYKLYVYVRPHKLKDGWHRDRIMQEISEQGVPCMQGICPEVYLEKAFEYAGTLGCWDARNAEPASIMGCPAGFGTAKQETGKAKAGSKAHRPGRGLSPEKRLPVAKKLGETSLMFEVHPGLGEKDMQDAVQAVAKVMARATKQP
ncbi:MAG: DegT/DnrJ/EryC1/StrS family aminotransferase [Desulfohalobiaceae bacterium]